MKTKKRLGPCPKIRTRGVMDFNLDSGDVAEVETAVESTLVPWRAPSELHETVPGGGWDGGCSRHAHMRSGFLEGRVFRCWEDPDGSLASGASVGFATEETLRGSIDRWFRGVER